MKKITLLALVSMLSLSVMAQSSHPLLVNNPIKLEKKELNDVRSASPKHLAEKIKMQIQASTNMLPTQEEEWLYEGAWKKYGDYFYSYDNRGNIVRKIYDDGETAVATDKVYNENNKYIESIDSYKEGDGEFIKSDKRVIEYDLRVTDFVINSESYEWIDNDWKLVSNGYTYKKVVNRNEKGNVTGVEIYTYFQDEYHLQIRSTITYNEDGLAEEFKYEELNFNSSGELEMQEVYTLKDLVWYRTDGQILVLDDVSAFFTEGNNRLRKASYYKNGRRTQMYEASYEENGDYSYKQILLQVPLSETVIGYTITDENGSSRTTINVYEDADMSNSIAEDEAVRSDTLTVTKNHYGVIVEERYVGDGEILYGAKYDYTYNEEYGSYPIEQVFMDYNLEASEYVPFLKIVGKDFIDVAGVKQAVVDNSTGEKIIYNLNGMRQFLPEENLPAGIYIVKEGNRVSKKVIK